MREEIEMYLLQALNMALQINGETSYTNSFTVKVIDDGFFFIPRLPSTYVIDDGYVRLMPAKGRGKKPHN